MWNFSQCGNFVERECLLFEAGDYPDKGLRVTEGDLVQIAANSPSEIPVKIEHLPTSPLDGVLGVVTQLRVVGKRLWGTLRQSVEMWGLMERSGARALSVGLDVEGKRVVEASLVSKPRVAAAQIFSASQERKGETETMSIRQFSEAIIGFVRGFGGMEPEEGGRKEFAAVYSQIEQEREQMQQERMERQLLDWKREGLIRATPSAEGAARSLLMASNSSVVTFDGSQVPVAKLFAEFVAANGPVVPMGEMMPMAPLGGDAGVQLAKMAQEKARKEGISYTQAFIAVASANPELAGAARG